MQERSWHILQGQESTGPHTELSLLRGYFAGRYSASTMVRAGADAEWVMLDAALPLEQLTPPPLPDGRSAARRATAWIDRGPYAWRRYFARQLDLLLGATLMSALIGAVLSVNDASYTAYMDFVSSGNRFALNIASVLLAVVPSALLIGSTGTSVGKLIFGLRVLNAEQKPAGILLGLKRELQVALRGLGAGLPLIPLITLIMSYNHLHSEGAAAWDTDSGLVTWYRAPSLAHAALMGLGILLWLACLIVLVALMARDV